MGWKNRTGTKKLIPLGKHGLSWPLILAEVSSVTLFLPGFHGPGRVLGEQRWTPAGKIKCGGSKESTGCQVDWSMGNSMGYSEKFWPESATEF